MRGKYLSSVTEALRGHSRVLCHGLLLLIPTFFFCSTASMAGIYAKQNLDGHTVWATQALDSEYVLVIPDADKPKGQISTNPSSLKAAKSRDDLRHKWMPEVRALTKLHGVDPYLVLALIETESNYDSKAVSKKGAVGMMQLMPATASRYGMRFESELLDPRKNILWGVHHLKDLLDKYNGHWALALSAYNAGSAATGRERPRVPAFNETMLYVPKVLAVVEQLKTMFMPGVGSLISPKVVSINGGSD
jgi:soluble lytic murein transglycosylase-like protein